MKPIKDLFGSATSLARVCVNLATITWSVVVLARDEALAPRLYIYHQMLGIMAEDYWAFIGLFVGIIGLWRLIRRSPLVWWGAIGYWLLMVFWVFLAAAIVNTDFLVVTPAALASIVVISLLSIYAAASDRGG